MRRAILAIAVLFVLVNLATADFLIIKVDLNLLLQSSSNLTGVKEEINPKGGNKGMPGGAAGMMGKPGGFQGMSGGGMMRGNMGAMGGGARGGGATGGADRGGVGRGGGGTSGG